jgi:hypothetical protein
MNELLLLHEVSQRLGIIAHRLVYAIMSGKVPEPKLRINNKRIFQSDDVKRLADHFGAKLSKEANGK